MSKRLHPVGSGQRLRILKRDDYTCQYCYEDATEVDHILPYSYKPVNTDANLVASCGECNRLASNMVFASFNEKYMYIKRRRRQRGNRVNPTWHARAVRAMMDDQGQAPKPAEVVKPTKPKYIRPAKVEVVKPTKVIKPKPIVEKVIRPKRHYYPPAPLPPVQPPPLDHHEFVAGMYEYYAKRNTPAYVREIFERWLMLETTRQWAAKNGRLLPA